MILIILFGQSWKGEPALLLAKNVEAFKTKLKKRWKKIALNVVRAVYAISLKDFIA